MEISSIDPAIRGVVEELNSLGLVTVSSCAGHPGEEVGQILFRKKYSHKKIRKVLDRYGISILGFKEIANPWYPAPRTEVEFESLGGGSIEALVDAGPFRLPPRKEAIEYFRAQGTSGKEAMRLACLMGIQEKRKEVIDE